MGKQERGKRAAINLSVHSWTSIPILGMYFRQCILYYKNFPLTLLKHIIKNSFYVVLNFYFENIEKKLGICIGTSIQYMYLCMCIKGNHHTCNRQIGLFVIWFVLPGLIFLQLEKLIMWNI